MTKEIDNELIRRCMGGDWSEADILLGGVEKWSYYLCRKMLQNEEDAQDAAQEVLLTVYQKLGTLKEPDAFWGWVRQITVNRCRNQLSRGPKETSIPADDEGNSLLDTYEDLDQQKVPDQALDNAETQRMIQELVDGLSPEQRMSVLLYYYDERSVKEIAQLMETTEGTVKSRLNYARKAIKGGVEDYEKQGVKLYGLSPLPFLLYFLRREAESTALDSAAVQTMVQGTLAAGGTATVSGGAGTAAGSVAASASGTSTSAGSGVASTATAVKTAAAAAGHGLAVKVTAAILAGTVALGGAGYLVSCRLSSALEASDASATQSMEAEPPFEPIDEPQLAESAITSEMQEENLALLRASYEESVLFGSPIHVGDFNGDGFLDAIVSSPYSTVRNEPYQECHLLTVRNGEVKDIMLATEELTTVTRELFGHTVEVVNPCGLYVGVRDLPEGRANLILADGTSGETLAFDCFREYQLDENNRLVEIGRVGQPGTPADRQAIQQFLDGSSALYSRQAYDNLIQATQYDVPRANGNCLEQLNYDCFEMSLMDGMLTIQVPSAWTSLYSYLDDDDHVTVYHRINHDLDNSMGQLFTLYLTSYQDASEIPTDGADYEPIGHWSGGLVTLYEPTDFQSSMDESYLSEFTMLSKIQEMVLDTLIVHES